MPEQLPYGEGSMFTGAHYRGIFKPTDELRPDFKIRPGDVKVDFTQGNKDAVVTMGPAIDNVSYGFLNAAVLGVSTPQEMFIRSQAVSDILPNIRFSTPRRVDFLLGGNKVGDITPDGGFSINSEYFLNREGMVRRLVREEELGYPYKFKVDTTIGKILGNEDAGHSRVEISFLLSTLNFELLQEKVEGLLQKPGITEAAIRSALNAVIKVHAVFSKSGEDESGGENIDLKKPRSDDGGSGVKK